MRTRSVLLALSLLFITALAIPVIAVEDGGIKNPFESFFDETGEVGSVMTVGAAVFALNTRGKFNRLEPKTGNLTISGASCTINFTNRCKPAFLRNDDKVGLRYLG